MPSLPLPAHCQACNLVFPLPTGVDPAISSYVFSCPRCHETGRIIDGYFEIGETIRALLQIPVEDLRALRDALKQRDATLVHALTKNHLTNYRSFLVAPPRSKTDTIARITLICLILNTLINGYDKFRQNPLGEKEIETIVAKAIASQPALPASPNAALGKPVPARRKAKHK
jgi:hypothetical protein